MKPKRKVLSVWTPYNMLGAYQKEIFQITATITKMFVVDNQ